MPSDTAQPWRSVALVFCPVAVAPFPSKQVSELVYVAVFVFQIYLQGLCTYL